MDRRLAQGKSASDEFGQATLPHFGMLYGVARRAAWSTLEVDDIVQETYLLALQGWERGRPEQVRPWLIAICRNVVRSRHRHRQRRPTEDPEADPATLPALRDTAEEALSSLTGAAVRAALRKLPRAQREAIVLMDLCGFTAAAVAQLLGAPRGTILARVHRGRKRLAGLLRAADASNPP